MHNGIYHAFLGAVEINDDIGFVFVFGKFFNNGTLADAPSPFDK